MEKPSKFIYKVLINLGLQNLAYEVVLKDVLKEILPPKWFHSIKSLRYKNGKLYLYIYDPYTRQELFLLKDRLKKFINDKAGEEVIKSLIIK